MSAWRSSALPVLLWLAPLVACAAEPGAVYGTVYAQLSPETLLDNARVRVQRFNVPPGASTGRHTHVGDALMVVLRGGVLTDEASGRAVLWRAGRVAWLDGRASPDAGSRNTGSSAVQLIWVAIKPDPPADPAKPQPPVSDRHLIYPNIPGEDLLENDRIIVQRFLVEPGQWEGVHAHLPNMLYIHIRGGQWATRTYREPQHTYPERSPDGEVGWMEPFPLSAGHESGNVGSQPIDLIWVTLKR